MQLTRFDRWLREKYVHEIHVYSLRPPEVLPPGVRSEEMPDVPGRKYRLHYIARSSRAADALIEQFKTHNQMFTTRVVDRSAWYVPLVAPEGKSITWWMAWVLLLGISVFTATNAIRSLWTNPEFRKNFGEAIEVLKG